MPLLVLPNLTLARIPFQTLEYLVTADVLDLTQVHVVYL